MIHAQNTKTLPALIGVIATNATSASAVIDTKDAQYVQLELSLPAATSGGTSTITSLKVQTAPTATGAWTDLPGTIGDGTTNTDFALPTSNDTANPHSFRIGVRKGGGVAGRYFRTVQQAAAGYVVVGVNANLDLNAVNPSQSPADVVVAA